MGEQDAFERIVASLHYAMLDDSRWPATSALVDEAGGLTGNDLIGREGPMGTTYPTDERVPRFRQLPDSRLVHVTDLFTAEELKTSPTYNEMLLRTGGQDSLNARLDGPDGSSIT